MVLDEGHSTPEQNNIGIVKTGQHCVWCEVKEQIGQKYLPSIQPSLMTMLCDQLRARCEGLGWFSMRRAIRWGMVHKERVLNVEIVQGAYCALWRLCSVEIVQGAMCTVQGKLRM